MRGGLRSSKLRIPPAWTHRYQRRRYERPPLHSGAQYAPPPPYAPPPGYRPYGYPPPPPPPPRGVYRSGLVVGFALGGGAITANDCATCGGGAGGLEGHIGGMLNPRLAVLAEGWFLARDVGGATLTNSVFTGALQFWLADQFWIKGGIGGGTINLSDNNNGGAVGESAFAVSGAAGLEIVQWFNFALDLQFRLAHVAYSGGGANNIAFMVGFNWY
jgi:hypothetical protein